MPAVHRIDRFTIPAAHFPELRAVLAKTHARLEAMPGCQRSDVVVDDADDAIAIVTHVKWRSEADYVAANSAMKLAHAADGFDPAARLTEWGATAQLGTYRPIDGIGLSRDAQTE